MQLGKSLSLGLVFGPPPHKSRGGGGWVVLSPSLVFSSSQSTYLDPNFQNCSRFGLFPKNQSEIGLNLLWKSDFLILDGQRGLERDILVDFWMIPSTFDK